MKGCYNMPNLNKYKAYKKIADIRNELVKGVQPEYCEDGIKVIKTYKTVKNL